MLGLLTYQIQDESLSRLAVAYVSPRVLLQTDYYNLCSSGKVVWSEWQGCWQVRWYIALSESDGIKLRL
jgi:hypothetical protein